MHFPFQDQVLFLKLIFSQRQIVIKFGFKTNDRRQPNKYILGKGWAEWCKSFCLLLISDTDVMTADWEPIKKSPGRHLFWMSFKKDSLPHHWHNLSGLQNLDTIIPKILWYLAYLWSVFTLLKIYFYWQIRNSHLVVLWDLEVLGIPWDQLVLQVQVSQDPL